MANGHGGRREGAGRKRKVDKFEAEVAAAERTIADALPQVLSKLLDLANGAVMEREEYEPAGTISVDDIEFEHTDKGTRPVRIKRPAFPDKKPEELVLTKRVIQHEPPDVRAAMYLTDRILGKPTERHEIEADISGQLDVDAAAMKQAAKELSEWRETRKAELEAVLGSNPLSNNPTAPLSAANSQTSMPMNESNESEPSSSPSASLTRPTSSTPIV